MKNALEKLLAQNKNGKFICVGLDTDIEKIPLCLRSTKDSILNFNRAIIDATYKQAAAFKINFAFYEKDGYEGMKNLSETIKHIPPDNLIIADVKRGDIGNTSQMYAKSVFEYYKCDAVTLNPLMGKDSLDPFLNHSNKLNFILALTSNKGANDFEKLQLENGKFLYQFIIEKVKEWNLNTNCGIVFGATKSIELENNMELIDDLPVLLPGVGAQGGSVEDVVNSFISAKRDGFLINISRGIIYKSGNEDFADQARVEITRVNEVITRCLNL